jgi:hypothetical protein
MFKAIKEFFTGKPAEVAPAVAPAVESAPYKVPEPAATTPIPFIPEPVQPVAEAKVDPVAVALDLEPLDLAVTTEPAKKPRKPRAPKVAVEKPVKEKAPTKARAPRKTALKVVKKD